MRKGLSGAQEKAIGHNESNPVGPGDRYRVEGNSSSTRPQVSFKYYRDALSDVEASDFRPITGNLCLEYSSSPVRIFMTLVDTVKCCVSSARVRGFSKQLERDTETEIRKIKHLLS